MIHRFEVTEIGMYLCGIRDITKEHFLYCLVIFGIQGVTHDCGFVKGWNGAFILQNCPLAC